MNFNIFSTSYVGIDIGRYKVEGVRIKKDKEKIAITSKFSVPYSKKIFEGEELKDENEIISALNKTGKNLKLNIEDFIVTSIFPDKTLFRQITLPKMPNKSQIINVVKFQIVKELSIPSENITVEVDVEELEQQESVAAFIARNEDIEKFKSIFSKALLPLPDIIDAGYMKFNYLVEEKIKNGISFITFEDNTSTYLELFKDGKFLAIDSTGGGADDLKDNNDVDAKIHYLQLSDEIQRLGRMMLSRYSLPSDNLKRIIFVSEKMDYVNIWSDLFKDVGLGESKNYKEFLNLTDDIPLGAYNLAVRGALESAKIKFLPKKS
jgi:Tfp pilus assembly PilM family ATPase